MSSKARKRQKRQEHMAAFGVKPNGALGAGPIHSIVEVHRTGDQAQRIEFNFGLILAKYGATLYGVDMAQDRVILHCQPGSQEAFELAGAQVVQNLVDSGVIPGKDAAQPETPSPTDNCRASTIFEDDPEGSAF